MGDSFALGAVFDGCGGLGGRRYEEFAGHTGAYVASRAAAQACDELFDSIVYATENGQSVNMATMADRMHAYISEKLNLFLRVSQSRSMLKGSLQKNFPTTVAACCTHRNPDGRGLMSNVLWAGDSRCFWLDDGGLHQLTVDDNDQPDALANIHEDAALTNVASASADYELHKMCLYGLGEGVLLAATDGCFGYYPTPMHFEYLLLGTLQESSDIDEWQERIASELTEVSGDDATLVAQIFQFDTFRSMKSYFKDRLHLLTKDYIEKFEDDPSQAPSLWVDYGASYNVYLENVDE